MTFSKLFKTRGHQISTYQSFLKTRIPYTLIRTRTHTYVADPQHFCRRPVGECFHTTLNKELSVVRPSLATMIKVNNGNTNINDVVLMSLLLTLNTFHTLFQCSVSIVNFKQVNATWLNTKFFLSKIPARYIQSQQ